MMQNHTTKRFLTTLLIGASAFGQSLHGRPLISVIENNSESSAVIEGCRGKTSAAVAANSKKQFAFPLMIPAIPTAKYRDQFISGEPYFPEEALIIKTAQHGRYAIWSDERGIVCAREHVPGVDRDACVPVTLLKQGDAELSEKIIRSVVLLLTINGQGTITVTEKKS